MATMVRQLETKDTFAVPMNRRAGSLPRLAGMRAAAGDGRTLIRMSYLQLIENSSALIGLGFEGRNLYYLARKRDNARYILTIDAAQSNLTLKTEPVEKMTVIFHAGDRRR
ncbi:MAG: hypothetical protein JO102_02620 [Elusimicrobia bacterium]|nr:hypothetical protein [Elusimicrobiota bacterium]